ncbi:hypothetical protein L6164_028546 [Bauhinia variegata]|uniref:Uncharacterized protein n=1 Tax=Bauhinia variegata TaxID=167791 RepID=A0ACB9L6I6_BAUVA|nr:hypothetical protein L6164_028546 [Bauhinia variegata]
MHKSPPYNDKDVDLYTVALWFRLLRQQGYNISCDIFEQFKEDNGALRDTYDAYGTVKELELFTEALERCDISLIDSLPECMKAVLKALLDLFGEMELLTAEIGMSSFVQYAKLDVQKLAQAYFIEAKWRDKGSALPSTPPWLPSCPREGRSLVVTLEKLEDHQVALVNDVLGMPSFYEAANLRIHGEDVLDHALEYITLHVKSVCNVRFQSFTSTTPEGSKPCHRVPKLAQAFLIEAKWRNKGYLTTDEYLKNSTIASGCPAIEATSFLALGHIATEEVSAML